MLKSYVIKKGFRWANRLTLKMWLSEFTQAQFMFSLTQSCEYSLIELLGPVNRIAGVSFGNHLNNSVSISWSGDQTGNYLYLDYYLDGSRFVEKICEWTPSQSYLVTLKRIGESVVNVCIEDGVTGEPISQLSMIMHLNGLKYRLGPYYAHKDKAKHNMEIMLEWLE